MPRVGVVGLGLIGASIARALRSAEAAEVIIGVDRDPTICARARADGVVAHAESSLATLPAQHCDFLFVCVPFGALSSVFAAIGQARFGGIVTDTCGVKVDVAALARAHLGDSTYVGSHPMAGGTDGGFEQARPDLFEGTPVAICATTPAAEEVAALWQAMGAEPVFIDADHHDAEVAHTSHLPYVAAVAQLALLDAPPRLVGRGFLDSTRHALFARDIMAEMVRANAHLPPLLRRHAQALSALADSLEHDPESWDRAVAHARSLRAGFRSC